MQRRSNSADKQRQLNDLGQAEACPIRNLRQTAIFTLPEQPVNDASIKNQRKLIRPASGLK
jgi:hypothetical protein